MGRGGSDSNLLYGDIRVDDQEVDDQEGQKAIWERELAEKENLTWWRMLGVERNMVIDIWTSIEKGDYYYYARSDKIFKASQDLYESHYRLREARYYLGGPSGTFVETGDFEQIKEGQFAHDQASDTVLSFDQVQSNEKMKNQPLIIVIPTYQQTFLTSPLIL